MFLSELIFLYRRRRVEEMRRKVLWELEEGTMVGFLAGSLSDLGALWAVKGNSRMSVLENCFTEDLKLQIIGNDIIETTSHLVDSIAAKSKITKQQSSAISYPLFNPLC
jgi:hypothetical protein